MTGPTSLFRPTLSSLMSFKPLDRVQLNDKRSIAELRIDRQMYGMTNPELPFLYYQHALPDGTIVVRSCGGTAVNVEVEDVCDVIPGDQVIIRAMTKMGFLQRISLSAKERNSPINEDLFHPAYVLWVSKSRWEICPRVWFVDDALNADAFNSNTFIAPIHQEDREILEGAAKRTIMPVSNYKTSSNASADTGVRRTTEFAAAVSSGLIKAGLRRQCSAVQRLATVGADPISRAKINQILAA